MFGLVFIFISSYVGAAVDAELSFVFRCPLLFWRVWSIKERKGGGEGEEVMNRYVKPTTSKEKAASVLMSQPDPTRHAGDVFSPSPVRSLDSLTAFSQILGFKVAERSQTCSGECWMFYWRAKWHWFGIRARCPENLNSRDNMLVKETFNPEVQVLT